MKKLSLSIDILALQGAKKISRDGRDFVVIEITKSRAKPHQNGKVYLNLEAIENKDGENQWGKTHWVCEPTTKEERESGLKLPILGNGKEWGDLAEVKKKAARPAPAREQHEESADPLGPMEDDEIPF